MSLNALSPSPFYSANPSSHIFRCIVCSLVWMCDLKLVVYFCIWIMINVEQLIFTIVLAGSCCLVFNCLYVESRLSIVDFFFIVCWYFTIALSVCFQIMCLNVLLISFVCVLLCRVLLSYPFSDLHGNVFLFYKSENFLYLQLSIKHNVQLLYLGKLFH